MNEADIARAKAAQRAYAKAWRAKNKDKVRESNMRYWIRRAEREAQEQAAMSISQEKEASTDG